MDEYIPERRRSNQDRRQSNQESNALELLAIMGRHFAESLDIQATIQHALILITKYIQAEGGALFLLEDNGEHLTCRASSGPVDITGITLGPNEGIVGYCISNNTPEIVRNVSEVENFQTTVDKQSGFTTHSVLCAPMTIKDTQIGAIEVVNKIGGDGLFTESDLMMLETLAHSAALAILNARMSIELMEQERVKKELELAAEIQRSLLPKSHLTTFPVCGVNYPAKEVSGDFYDFFELENGCIYFCIGDVSGKGMNAALLMSKAASLFRCLGKSIHDPGILSTKINNEIFETATHGMFVTMISGILDPNTNMVKLVNAGHEPLLLFDSNNEFEEFPANTIPLGIMPFTEDSDYIQETTLSIDGKSLYLFTDGVTEGNRKNGKPMGRDGLKEIIVSNQSLLISKIINLVTTELAVEKNMLRDDITILAIGNVKQ